eukprot:757923-Hanusia_phi.AAC.3
MRSTNNTKAPHQTEGWTSSKRTKSTGSIYGSTRFADLLLCKMMTKRWPDGAERELQEDIEGERQQRSLGRSSARAK